MRDANPLRAMTRIFVYGTLKRGCKNHQQLAGQHYIGTARTIAGYSLYDLGDYPGMVADPADARGVSGEIWSVDDPTLAQLDDFEGVNAGLYRRVPIPLLPPFHTDTVNTYVYAQDLLGRQPIGDVWLEQ